MCQFSFFICIWSVEDEKEEKRVSVFDTTCPGMYIEFEIRNLQRRSRVMKISTKGRYGLRVLLDIALYRVGDKPRMIREIAANQEISEKYISRLIIELRKAGFVKSVRGAKGGYTLMRKPEEISILDVLEVMEGPVCIVDCVSASGGECRRTMLCPTRRMWTEINQKIRDIFAGYTLQDLLELYVSNGEAVLDYCI